MICSQCGTNNLSSVSFCVSCGAELGLSSKADLSPSSIPVASKPKLAPAETATISTEAKVDYYKVFRYKTEYMYAKVLSIKDDYFYCEAIDNSSVFFIKQTFAKKPDLTPASVGDSIWVCRGEYIKAVDDKLRYKVLGQTKQPTPQSASNEFTLFKNRRKQGHLFSGPVTDETDTYWQIQVSPSLYGKCLKPIETTDSNSISISSTPLMVIQGIDIANQEITFRLYTDAATSVSKAAPSAPQSTQNAESFPPEAPKVAPEAIVTEDNLYILPANSKNDFQYKSEYMYAKILGMKEDLLYCEAIDDISAFFLKNSFAKKQDLTHASVGDSIWVCRGEYIKTVDGKMRYKVTGQTVLPSPESAIHEFTLFKNRRKPGQLFRAPVTGETATYWEIQISPSLYGKCYKPTSHKAVTDSVTIGTLPLLIIQEIDPENQQVTFALCVTENNAPIFPKKASLWDLIPSTLDQILVPRKILQILQDEKDISPLAAAMEGNFTFAKFLTVLGPRYAQAYQEKLIAVKQTATAAFIDFDTGYKNIKGAPISVGIKLNKTESNPRWVVNLLGFTSVESVFDRYIHVADMDTCFNELADLTLGGEDWDYAGAHEKGKKYILKQYLRFNFYKSKLDELLVTNEGGDAVFNTGLVDSTYDEIFCYLKRNTNRTAHPQMWQLEFFACWGKGKNGKKLNTLFQLRPAAPQYIDPTRVQDIFYDVTKSLSCDYDHIIEDNLGRLPLSFLRRRLSYSSEVVEVLDRYEKSHAYRDFQTLLRLVVDNEDYLRDIVDGLKSAVETAKKHCKWNYKTAIPIYYPRNNNVSLLLPLCLSNDNSKADVALVVERLENGNYQGQTILTLQMAYLDARQICRPNSEWLTASRIAAEAAEDSDTIEDSEDDDGV